MLAGYGTHLARLYVTSRRRWQGIRYLSYHSIVDADELEEGESSFSITVGNFRRQLEAIKALGIEVISLHESVKMLEAGTVEGQHIVITFDDGYLDGYSVAWPILKEFGFPAHYFIVVGKIGLSFGPEEGERGARTYDVSKRCMGTEMLQKIRSEGGTFGCHSMVHSPLTLFADEEARRMLRDSKNRLEEILNIPIDTFAYPQGIFNARIIKAVRDVGYRWAFSIGIGCVRSFRHTDRCAIERNVFRDDTPSDVFNLMIEGGYDWARSYQRLKHFLKHRNY